MEIKIRQAEERDFDALLDLMHHGFNGQIRFLDKKSNLIVAEHNGIPVGVLSIAIDQPDVPVNARYLSSLTVHPDFRNRGIASRLLRAVFEQESQKSFYFHASDEMAPFYRKLFSEIGHDIHLIKKDQNQVGLYYNKEKH